MWTRLNRDVKDGDNFAGDDDNRDRENHKTDMISFVYLVIVLSNMYI